MKPVENTPVEIHSIGSIPVWVKREDLAAVSPAPPFSKIRGLYTHLTKLKARGIKTIGYVETSISMAGWGAAWCCEDLGLKAVLFDPQYKETPKLLNFHRKQWKMFSPDIIPIPAGRARINYYVGRKLLMDRYGPHAVMLDLGLPLKETVAETAAEWRRTIPELPSQPGSIVINVGSGTICAGIVRGWRKGEGKIIGVMGRSGNVRAKTKSIRRRAQRLLNGLLGVPFQLEDPGWEYTEKSRFRTPFPCHPYYDKKAWEWLEKHIEEVPQPVLFWNIGRMR